jgi:hypothetical protein
VDARGQRRRAEALDPSAPAGVGGVVGGEPVGVEREAAAVDHHAADEGAVATDPLGGGVHHDVGALLERPAQVAAAAPGVVDDQRRPGGVGQAASAGRSGTVQLGLAIVSTHTATTSSSRAVGDRLEGRRHRRHPQAPRLEPLAEQREGAAERLLRQDDAGARPRQGQQGGGGGRLARGQRHRGDAALEVAHPLGEGVDGRVVHAGVLVAAGLPAKRAAAWAASRTRSSRWRGSAARGCRSGSGGVPAWRPGREADGAGSGGGGSSAWRLRSSRRDRDRHVRAGWIGTRLHGGGWPRRRGARSLGRSRSSPPTLAVPAVDAASHHTAAGGARGAGSMRP